MSFRKSIGAVCLSFLFLVALSLDASSRFPRGAGGFNNGRMQTGLGAIQFDNAFPFINLIKGGQNFSCGSTLPTPAELDSNGYPLASTTCLSNVWQSVFYAPTQTERPGNYVFTVNGNGTMFLGMSNTVLPTATFTGAVAASVLTAGAPSGGTIQKGMALTGTGVTAGTIIGDQLTGSAGAAGTYRVVGSTTVGSTSMTVDGGSKTAAGGSGRFVFSTTDYRFVAGLSAQGTPAISDMKIFHVDDEAAITAGEVFGTKFLARMSEANFGVIRYLDWLHGNDTNVTTWATRKPANYVCYYCDSWPPEMWAGDTTNSGNTYTASVTPTGWAGLVDKATVIVRWNATATADNATLNVAGTGAIAIKDYAGNLTDPGNNSRPKIGFFSTLVYDALLNCWLKFGGDDAFGHFGVRNGTPPETMLALGVKARSHLYYVSPYLSMDPATDFMPSLMKYNADNAPSWMVNRYEGTNELWNTRSGFYGSLYALNKAALYWSITGDNPTAFHNWYGKEMSLLGQMASAIYSGNRSRYQVLLGVQTATTPSSSDLRQTAARYVVNGPAQSSLTGSWGTINFTQSAASGWATHVTLTQYISPSEQYKIAELQHAFAYVVTNAGNPTAQQAIADAYADTLAGASEIYNLNYAKANYIAWCAWAVTYSQGCTGYEGGYSPDYGGQAWTSPITGATATNPCVLTLATTNNERYDIFSPLSGNAAVAGMTLTISGLGGALGTLLNGNTYTIQSGVSGNSVPINVNCTAAAYTTAGTASYVNAALWTNTLRYASKWATGLTGYTTTNLNNFAAAGGVFPANLNLSSPSTGAIRTDPIGFGGVWAPWDPSVWTSPPSTAWPAYVTFNR